MMSIIRKSNQNTFTEQTDMSMFPYCCTQDQFRTGGMESIVDWYGLSHGVNWVLGDYTKPD